MGRTIIVGDVHGCAAELEELLLRVHHGSADAVVFVGDLVARGPDTAGVLSIYRQVAGRSVLGNHESRLLDARRALEQGRPRRRLSPPDYALLRNLSDDDWSLLDGWPLHLDLSEHSLRVVHAGLVPGRPLAEHDEWTLTHLRTVTPEGQPSAGHEHRLWGELYEPPAGEPHVAFGHNSRVGLQIHSHATGLDTGCVYGGRLSALVLESGEEVPSDARCREQRIVSVAARRCHYRGRPPR